MSMIRVSDKAHSSLKEMATVSGMPMQTILDTAIEEHRKRVFLEALNADFASLRSNPEAWNDEVEERDLWEQTLGDGVANE
ncbi:MAG: hypothetical protein JWQ02_3584 [Capsulimonas sp.]|jgi:hypothetical protein|nr:hypothetical protein [Capsulimonas sp.]